MLLRPHLLIFLLMLLAISTGEVRTTAQGQIDRATLEEPGEKTPEISTAELRTILREHRAVVIDTRDFKEYAMGHIPGAIDAAPKPGMPVSLYISDVNEVRRIVKEKTSTPVVLYCNGPFDERTRILADMLLGEGFTSVRRYQLGLSIWRALGGPVQIELAGVALVLAKDRTAIFVDAREPEEFKRNTLPGARNLPERKLAAAKDNEEIQGGQSDEPLPSDDLSARVIVFGDNPAQARRVAETLAREGFSNVSFFAGTFEELLIAAAADKVK